jgi:hypothetical protein
MSEYTGKDVSYYLVKIAKPKRLDPYTAECEDIIEALGMSFAEGCAFKAIWRKCSARTLGLAKAGYKGGLYDAEKAQYYGARMVAAEERLPGAAKPVEDRRPTPPVPECPHCQAKEGQFHHPDCHLMRRGKSVLGLTIAAAQAEAVRRALDAEKPLIASGERCPECEYPTDAAGTHYATCSKLTAPKEFVEQIEQVFDELEGTEPAAEIDDDSPRQQAVQQNGNDGAVYDDHWFGAPEWAKYKAQDADGEWFFYSHLPVLQDGLWARTRACIGQCEFYRADNPDPHWRDTLITRT